MAVLRTGASVFSAGVIVILLFMNVTNAAVGDVGDADLQLKLIHFVLMWNILRGFNRNGTRRRNEQFQKGNNCET